MRALLRDRALYCSGDYQELYDRLISVERLILASPIYFTNVTAQAKAMIDRCQCLWARRYVLRAPLPATPSGQRGKEP